MAPTINVGDTVPEGKFTYVPYTPELADGAACGIPTSLSTNDWKGKKVVIIAVPGAFTPTCHVNHIPPFVQNFEKIKEKGVDVVAIVAANDPFVMSGWGRVNGGADKILYLTDAYAEWSKKLGLDIDLTARGLGIRTNRYAIILDDLVVKYVEVESEPGVSVSGFDAVFAKL